MPIKDKCVGFSGYLSTVAAYEGRGKDVFVLFSGSKDETTGKSWCPDCVTAYPVIEEGVEKYLDNGSVFIYCEVGPREVWKDQKNEFRTDEKLKLKSVPTLMNLKDPKKRLEELQCAKIDLLEMLFKDED